MASASLVYIGIKGNVLALDRATGAEVWRAPLKGGDFVNLVLHEGDLYAATSGELFCVDAASGQVRWSNPLRGLGFGLISIAQEGGQQSLLLAEKHRQDVASQNAASSGA